MNSSFITAPPANFFDESTDDDYGLPSSPLSVPKMEVGQTTENRAPLRIQNISQDVNVDPDSYIPNYRNYLDDQKQHSLDQRPGLADFIKLTSSPIPPPQHRIRSKIEPSTKAETTLHLADFSKSSYDGSVEEEMPNNPPSSESQNIEPCAAFSDCSSHHIASRISTALDKKIINNKHTNLSKCDKILNAHAITLRALLQGEEEIKVPGIANDTPRTRTTTVGSSKRVSLAPPPIEVPKSRIPLDPVRTPYPAYTRWKNSRPFQPSSPTAPQETVIILTIRRNKDAVSTRITSLYMPNPIDSGNVKVISPTYVEKLFLSEDFDDCCFFKQLRAEYANLCGRFRFFSARKLQKIVLKHRALLDCDLNCTNTQLQAKSISNLTCAWHSSRPTNLAAMRGLSDTFSEEKMMEQYRNPDIGRARYAWVHWVHRFAASCTDKQISTPSVPQSYGSYPISENAQDSNSNGRRDHPEVMETGVPCIAGFEFVEGWALGRIILAFSIVIFAAISAVLLWIFLGVAVTEIGFRGAGARVGTGLLMGGLVLLFGFAGLLGWIWLSWLII